MKKNIFLIEDEPLAVERIRRLLQEADPSSVIIGEADSIVSAVAGIQQHNEIDLILADIELKDGKVFQVFKQIAVHCPVVFITSYDEYMLQAFKVNALDYLLKPVRREELQSCLKKYEVIQKHQAGKNNHLERLLEQLSSSQIPSTARSRFLIKQGNKFIPIDIKEIAYFYSSGRYTYLRTWECKNHIIDHTMEQLEELLDRQIFYRANRAFFVHIDAVKQITKDITGKLKLDIEPAFKEDIYVSKERAGSFRKWMER